MKLSKSQVDDLSRKLDEIRRIAAGAKDRETCGAARLGAEFLMKDLRNYELAALLEENEK